MARTPPAPGSPLTRKAPAATPRDDVRVRPHSRGAAGNVADKAMMLRVLTRFESPPPADVAEQRQRVADLCRMLESQVVRPEPGKGANAGGSPHAASPGTEAGPANVPPVPPGATGQPSLSPRMRQTLQRLLAGEAEKQIARARRQPPHRPRLRQGDLPPVRRL